MYSNIYDSAKDFRNDPYALSSAVTFTYRSLLNGLNPVITLPMAFDSDFFLNEINDAGFQGLFKNFFKISCFQGYGIKSYLETKLNGFISSNTPFLFSNSRLSFLYKNGMNDEDQKIIYGYMLNELCGTPDPSEIETERLKSLLQSRFPFEDKLEVIDSYIDSVRKIDALASYSDALHLAPDDTLYRRVDKMISRINELDVDTGDLDTRRKLKAFRSSLKRKVFSGEHLNRSRMYEIIEKEYAGDKEVISNFRSLVDMAYHQQISTTIDDNGEADLFSYENTPFGNMFEESDHDRGDRPFNANVLLLSKPIPPRPDTLTWRGLYDILVETGKYSSLSWEDRLKCWLEDCKNSTHGLAIQNALVNHICTIAALGASSLSLLSPEKLAPVCHVIIAICIGHEIREAKKEVKKESINKNIASWVKSAAYGIDNEPTEMELISLLKADKSHQDRR